jgi:hypothetical protein
MLYRSSRSASSRLRASDGPWQRSTSSQPFRRSGRNIGRCLWDAAGLHLNHTAKLEDSAVTGALNHAPGAQVHVSSKRSSGLAFASRGCLDGSRFGFCLDCRGQAAAPDRTGERANADLSPVSRPDANHNRHYGAEFAAHSDSLAYRTIGICVFLRTVMCHPFARARSPTPSSYPE